MGERQVDSYREQKEARRRAYMATRTLREVFPQMEEVVLQLTFNDPENASQHSPQTHNFLPGAKAFFQVPCPFSMCIGGGFDLSPVIAQLASHGGREASGELTCHGRQSRNRPDAHRCLLQMRYRLSVRYRV